MKDINRREIVRYFASTKFYLTEKSNGEIEVSANGKLYEGEALSSNHKDVEEYERQLCEHIANFRYIRITDAEVEADKKYMEARL